MDLAAGILIVGGALLGGFVSGLAGFGTALVTLGIWLHAVPPAQAATLVIICSVVSQAQTMPAIWHAVELRRVWPMLVMGVAGVPFGVFLLGHVNAVDFRCAVGVVLLAFSSVMLAGRGPRALAWGGGQADAAVGLAGGVLGGLAGLSGALPTMWATLRGWSKDKRRGVFQVYNLTVLTAAMAMHAAAGLITRQVGFLLLLALPGTISGAWAGAHAYKRLSDHRFHQLVLGLLGVSGVTLVWPVVIQLFAW
jgi:uncharacterized membrane protein YfcA